MVHFQGCTLSPKLFNIVIQLLLDILEKPDLQFSAAGYRFSGLKDCSLLSSAYADDIELVTSSAKENQALLIELMTEDRNDESSPKQVLVSGSEEIRYQGG